MTYLKIEKSSNNYYLIKNYKDVPLGEILFERLWRKFVFRPFRGTYYTHECLQDLAAYTESLTEDYKLNQTVNSQFDLK